LSNYQETSKGDGKRCVTEKETIKEIIGRSPDASDCFIMRQYFVIRNQMLPDQGVMNPVTNKQREIFMRNKNNLVINSTK
jgi:hypothetical protein